MSFGCFDRVSLSLRQIDQKKLNAAFWKDFAQKFSGPDITRVWLNKFQSTVGNREIDWRKNEDKFWYSLKLGRDFKGYEIGPHTDTLDKVHTGPNAAIHP